VAARSATVDRRRLTIKMMIVILIADRAKVLWTRFRCAAPEMKDTFG